MDNNAIVREKVIECFNKDMNPKQTAEYMQSLGITRPSDGKTITRKDVNNRLLGLRNSGVLPSLKKNNKITKGASVSNITIDQVKEATGMSQAKIAKKVKVNPTSIVRWKKDGIPKRYVAKFEKIMGNKSVTLVDTPEEAASVTPVVTKTVTKKRKYNRRKPVTPVLTEVKPSEVGVEETSLTVFVVTKDKAVISELLSRFV